MEDESTPLYPGVKFSRGIAIFDGLMFVCDLLNSAEEHTYDWPYHPAWNPKLGTDVFNHFVTPFKLNKTGDLGYKLWGKGKIITDCRSAEMPIKSCSISIPIMPRVYFGWGDKSRIKKGDIKMLRMTFPSFTKTTFIEGKMYKGYYPEPGPIMILRQKGKNASFACVFDVLNKKDSKPRVKSIEKIPLTTNGKEVHDPLSGAWQIDADSGSYLVVINRTGKTVSCANRQVTQPLVILRCN